MHLVRLAALAACLAAASSSIAAPFPASGGNAIQPQAASSPIDPYQDHGSGKKCTLEGDCGAVFTAIQGSRVLIVHTSCVFVLKNGGSVALAGLSVQDRTLFNALPVTKMADVSGGAYYVINAQTYLFFSKGKVPRVDVYSAVKPVVSLGCTISGYHA